MFAFPFALILSILFRLFLSVVGYTLSNPFFVFPIVLGAIGRHVLSLISLVVFLVFNLPLASSGNLFRPILSASFAPALLRTFFTISAQARWLLGIWIEFCFVFYFLATRAILAFWYSLKSMPSQP